MADGFREKIARTIPSKYHRFIVLGLVGLVVFGVLYAVVSQSPPPKPAARTPPKQRQVFMPADLDKRMGIAGVSSELERVRKQNAALQKKLEETQELVKQMKGKLPDVRDFQQEVDRRIQEALQKQPPDTKPQEAAKPPAKEEAKPAGQEWWREFQQDKGSKTPPAPTPPAPKEAKAPAAKPVKPGEPVKPEPHKPGDIRVVSAKDSQKEGVAAVKDKKKKEEDKGTFLPAGSIFSGTLLTGMDVPTGHQGRRDPFPVLLRVKKEAILPNRYRTDVRECFLVASGWGDLSSERAYVRAERLSCIRDDGKALESNLQMYAVGEDGKAGIRGRVVNKTGALLGRALIAGFLEGFSKLFGKQPMFSIYTPSSVGRNAKAPFESYLSSDALQSAGLSGAGSAMDRLAKYYIEMAENIYPVIEIDAGRAIDFILLSGVNLKLQQGKVTVGE